MSVISIVPRLPPAIDGVGDYALHLAHQLATHFQIKNHFIVGDPSWQNNEHLLGFPATAVAERSQNAIWAALQHAPPSTTILLHYVGHGYAKRGCPFWLVNGLEQWKQGHPNLQVVTMFHELYAVGMPWHYDFWLSSTQKQLAARVSYLSDRCLTSTERYAKTLDRLSHGKHSQVPILPIFSNMGEPPHVLPLSERQPRLVIFGQYHTKQRVYQESLSTLAAICQALKIKEIWDIGPTTHLSPSAINNIPVIEVGQQSATEVSKILASSMVGFLNYDPKRLAKSGVFAAYCAHGLIPVNQQKKSGVTDSLEVGKHYWTIEPHSPLLPSTEDWQAIATNAHRWYQTHNLSIQAQMFAHYIQGHTYFLSSPVENNIN